MKKILFVLLLTAVVNVHIAYAAKETGCTKPLNEKYSFKDFMNQSFKTVSASEFSGTCIKGSMFYQEWKEGDLTIEKDIFPAGAIGIEFVRCNLDNVKVLPNHSIDTRTFNRLIKIQNDWDDWVVDIVGNPVEPLNKEERIASGISIAPVDIPLTKFTEGQRYALDKSITPDPTIP